MSRWAGSEVRSARAYWAQRLPQPCSRCSRPVLPEQRWQVDHLVPRALGGPKDRSNEWPAHARCNEQAGSALGAQLVAARRRTQPIGNMNAERDRGIRGI